MLVAGEGITNSWSFVFFFFQAEDGIRDYKVTGVQTCALPIYIAISSELALPSKGEIGSGTMTKRIATRRMSGVESTKQSYVAAPAAPAADASAFAVIEYDDSTGHKTYRMTKDEIVVGRGGRDYWTDIKLETLPDVSREHFRLRRDPANGQFFLKDLSQLGTTIDGAKAPLQHRVGGRRKARSQPGGAGALDGAH